MTTATIDLRPGVTDLIVPVNGNYTLITDPLTRSDVVISRTDKRLRFLIKPIGGDDIDALKDFDSVNDPTIVYGVGEAASGVWAVNLSGQLPALGLYQWRMDLTSTASLDDGEPFRGGTFSVVRFF